jgi:glycosyltransferase involved in cell wall biosynthesis
VKVLAFPRDPNPYQGLLYRAMRRLGVEVSYLGDLTPSHTLNLLLLPLETGLRRATGARLVHLHWVFVFTLPGAERFPFLRRLGYAWFQAWLLTCRVLGMRLVWTAHNVLPHRPVFADDVAARRTLVRACDLVLAHSPSTLAELAALGAVARRSAVVPQGPSVPMPRAASLRTPGDGGGPCRFLFFGRVEEYKGVDDLLAAFAALPGGATAQLTVAGQCDDPRLRSRLGVLAAQAGADVELRLEHVPGAELDRLLAAADVVVLPFRNVTSSSSALHALCYGRPLILPDLPGLADLPDAAVLRYHGGAQNLAAAVVRLASADAPAMAAMSAAARDYASGAAWPDIAQRTVSEMSAVLSGGTPSRKPAESTVPASRSGWSG